MKKLHFLIPTILATSCLPFISLVSCGEKPKETYKVSFSTTEGGSVTPSSLDVVEGTTFGTVIHQLDITINDGFTPIKWIDVDTQEEVLTSDVIEKPLNVQLVFKKIPIPESKTIEIMSGSHYELREGATGTLNVKKNVTFGQIKSQLLAQIEPIDYSWDFDYWVDQYGWPVEDTKTIDENFKVQAVYNQRLSAEIKIQASAHGKTIIDVTYVEDGITFGEIKDKLKNFVQADEGFVFDRWVYKNGGDVEDSQIVRTDFVARALFCTDGLDYELDENNHTATVREYYGINPIVIIPKSIVVNKQNYDVIAISDAVFALRTYIVAMEIRANIVSIGQGTFQECRLLSTLIIPNSVTQIGQYAFSGCGMLGEVVIPDGVETIQEGTFNGCKSLVTISLPASTKHIAKDNFAFCNALTDVSGPSHTPGIIYRGTKDQWRDVERDSNWLGLNTNKFVQCSNGISNIYASRGQWANIETNIRNGKIIGATESNLTSKGVTLYLKPDLGYSWPKKEDIVIDGLAPEDIDWSLYNTDDCQHNDYGTIILKDVPTNLSITASCPESKKLDSNCKSTFGDIGVVYDTYDDYSISLHLFNDGSSGTVKFPDHIEHDGKKYYLRQIPHSWSGESNNIEGVIFEDDVRHLRKIGKAAFFQTNALDIYNSDRNKMFVFPEGLEEIGAEAFGDTYLTTSYMMGYSFPSTLKTVGGYAFGETPKIKKNGYCIFRSHPSVPSNMFKMSSRTEGFTLVGPTEDIGNEINDAISGITPKEILGCRLMGTDANVSYSKFGTVDFDIDLETLCEPHFLTEDIDFNCFAQYLEWEQVPTYHEVPREQIKIGPSLTNPNKCSFSWSNLDDALSSGQEYHFKILFDKMLVSEIIITKN